MTKTIHGAPRQYNETELKTLQENHRQRYKNSTDSKIKLKGSYELDLLRKLENSYAAGYRVCEKLPHELSSPHFSVWVIKPDHEQEVDLAALEITVKASYIAELEAEHADFKNRLYEQLVEAEERKQAAKAQAAKDKVLTDLRKQAEACYTPLTLPDAR
ncbi:hypothetical protein [Pseudomonas helleri]|uniref:hypothetical protein n=1 Tax=Pseudomonas helleri TaxID=1608996 RepID=UPI0028E2D35D|nr:hypothetical protein [Pseudomonas helleri]